MRLIFLLAALSAAWSGPMAGTAFAGEAEDIAMGKALAETNCAVCHAIGPSGDSTLEAAPAFRDIPLRYDPEELEDAFNEGVATEHPAMPDWQMTPDEARQLAAYIMSLKAGGKLKSEAPTDQRGEAVAGNP
jgi:mono/diheme cytochrome c family protein